MSSEPAALISRLRSLGYELSRIGLEAGPLSQWLFAAMREAGLAVELLETRHVRDAFKAMPVKSDRNDARGIAQLMRLGWFRPVHCKSMGAQETRAVLTARKLVQSKLRDVENSLRGILRGFGLKVGKTTELGFAGRIEELVVGHPHLEMITNAVLAVHAVLRIAPRVQRRVVQVLEEIDRDLVPFTSNKVGAIKNFQSLAPQAQTLGLPIGALKGHVNGGYYAQVEEARVEFAHLAREIVKRMEIKASSAAA